MINKIFSAKIGTENYGFSDIIINRDLVLYLESLKSIVTEDIVPGAENQREVYLSTKEFANQLLSGHLEVTRTLFVKEEFITTYNDIYSALRAERASLVSPKYFDSVKSLITEINPQIKMEETDLPLKRKAMFKSVVSQKTIILANFFIAEAIFENREIRDDIYRRLGRFSGPEQIDDFLNNNIGKLEEYKERFTDTQMLKSDLFTILRHKYI